MSFEQCEFIKAIVGISICLLAIVVMVVKDILDSIEDKRYRRELMEIKKIEDERREKKLENLKLDSISINLSEVELEMLDNLCAFSKCTRDKYLRGFIRDNM